MRLTSGKLIACVSRGYGWFASGGKASKTRATNPQHAGPLRLTGSDRVSRAASSLCVISGKASPRLSTPAHESHVICMRDRVLKACNAAPEGPSSRAASCTLPHHVSTASLLTGGRCLGSKTIESHAIVQSRHLASSNRGLCHLPEPRRSLHGPSKDVTKD